MLLLILYRGTEVTVCASFVAATFSAQSQDPDTAASVIGDFLQDPVGPLVHWATLNIRWVFWKNGKRIFVCEGTCWLLFLSCFYGTSKDKQI